MFAEYSATAKRGTWQKIGGLVRTLTKFALASINIGEMYECDFHSLTEGGFYVRLESPTASSFTYYLILVAPDNSLKWASISSMTVQGAIEHLRDETKKHPITYWEEFTKWFDGKYNQYSGIITKATVCGRETSNIPTYSNPAHDVSVWFAWLATIGQSVYLNNLNASDYQVSDYQYSIPMRFTTTRGEFSFALRVAI